MTEATMTPSTKTELLDRLQAGRAAWDILIAQVPDERLTAPILPNDWSVKDLLAHVAAYEQWTATQITAAHEHRTPTNLELYGVDELPVDADSWDLDQNNAAIYARYQEVPLAEVQVFAADAFNHLIAAVEAVPDAELNTPREWARGTSILDIVPGQSYAHYAHHVDDLKAIVSEAED